MKVGQIYCSAKTGIKARIVLIDRRNNLIEIEWFGDNDRSVFSLLEIERFVKNEEILIYDELPAGDPNLLFKENKS